MPLWAGKFNMEFQLSHSNASELSFPRKKFVQEFTFLTHADTLIYSIINVKIPLV